MSLGGYTSTNGESRTFGDPDVMAGDEGEGKASGSAVTVDELGSLKKTRTALKGWLTRAVVVAKESLASSGGDSAAATVALETLQKRKKDVEDVQTKIMELLEPAEIAEELSREAVAVEEAGTLAIALRNMLVLPKGQATQQQTPSTGTHSSNTSHEGSSTGFRLPKITVQEFHGEIRKWPEFWDMFQIAVNQRSDLSKVEKLAHLKSLLKGSAAGVLEGLAITDGNYDVAVDRLKRRYGGEEVVKERLICRFVDLPPVTSDKNVAGLRRLVDDVSAYSRGLENCGVTASEYSTMLIPIVREKLPASWRLEWARAKSNSSSSGG